MAIWGKHLDVVEYLLSSGWDVDSPITETGETCFLEAVVLGYVEGIDLFVERGCNIEAKNYDCNGALVLAMSVHRFPLIKKLIELGLSVNETHQNGYTSLHSACSGGFVAIAEYLLENGAGIEAEDADGSTPFLIVCSCNSEGVIDLLISKGCNIYAKSKGGTGALGMASWKGHVEIAEKLVQLGFDVNEAQGFGKTSLHFSARTYFHTLKLAEFLIRNGAKLEVEDERGNTPFLVCATTNKVAFMDMLISKGCNVQAKNKVGRGVLGAACANGEVKMTRKLLEMGFSLFETDYFGRTPLHWAAKYTNKEVAEILVDRGANVEAQDKWGRTPYLDAVRHGCEDVANLFLSKGCNRHAVDHEGHGALALACIEKSRYAVESFLSRFSNQDLNSVLHLAVLSNSDDTVGLLISNGADIETQDKWGCTPLVTAIEFGSDRVIDFLLKEGCNMYAETKTGECVLDVAIMAGRLDLFHRFVKAGINAMQLLPETRRFLQKAATSGSEAAVRYLKEISFLQVSDHSLNWASPQECYHETNPFYFEINVSL
ncbi:ankyrin repeat domain-containing protein 50-like isoform X2 [Oscarella lobularis]